MTKAIVLLAIWLSLAEQAQASGLAPGEYIASGHPIYVGVEHRRPGAASNDFFDPTSQRTGELRSMQDLRLRVPISEEPHRIDAPQGRLGFSLNYTGARARATVILIHGNDAEAREMRFIIPFFRKQRNQQYQL